MSHNTISRRHVLQSLSVLGLAAGLRPLPARAALSTDQAKPGAATTMTETRLLMGTFVTITLAGNSRDQMTEAMGKTFEHMIGLVALFDRFDSASPVSVLNAQGSLGDIPPALTELLDRSLRFGSLTDNAFNMTVQPLVDLFRRYQNPTGRMHIPQNELKEARALIVADGVQLRNGGVTLARNGMGITLDGIAKGHIADETSLFLNGLGMPNHLINAGGDIVAHGTKTLGQPWRVAVQSPSHARQHSRFGRSLVLRDQAVATSGSYAIFYDASRNHHHLINPVLGASPTQISSVTVMAKNALEADALATSLSVMPPRDGMNLVASLPGRECMMLTASGQALTSPGWTA